MRCGVGELCRVNTRQGHAFPIREGQHRVAVGVLRHNNIVCCNWVTRDWIRQAGHIEQIIRTNRIAIGVQRWCVKVLDHVIAIIWPKDNCVHIAVRIAGVGRIFTKVNGVVPCATVDGVRACACVDGIVARAAKNVILPVACIHIQRRGRDRAVDGVVLVRRHNLLDILEGDVRRAVGVKPVNRAILRVRAKDDINAVGQTRQIKNIAFVAILCAVRAVICAICAAVDCDCNVGVCVRWINREHIIAGAAKRHIATANCDVIVTDATLKDVITCAANQRVGTRAANDGICAIATGDQVVIRPAIDRVVAICAVDGVIATVAFDHIIPVRDDITAAVCRTIRIVIAKTHVFASLFAVNGAVDGRRVFAYGDNHLGRVRAGTVRDHVSDRRVTSETLSRGKDEFAVHNRNRTLSRINSGGAKDRQVRLRVVRVCVIGQDINRDLCLKVRCC